MGQVSFGTVLREARERKGYDVQSAARRLRIRPDILPIGRGDGGRHFVSPHRAKA